MSREVKPAKTMATLIKHLESGKEIFDEEYELVEKCCELIEEESDSNYDYDGNYYGTYYDQIYQYKDYFIKIESKDECDFEHVDMYLVIPKQITKTIYVRKSDLNIDTIKDKYMKCKWDYWKQEEKYKKCHGCEP